MREETICIMQKIMEESATGRCRLKDNAVLSKFEKVFILSPL
jgi:hypothetical protein